MITSCTTVSKAVSSPPTGRPPRATQDRIDALATAAEYLYSVVWNHSETCRYEDERDRWHPNAAWIGHDSFEEANYTATGDDIEEALIELIFNILEDIR